MVIKKIVFFIFIYKVAFCQSVLSNSLYEAPKESVKDSKSDFKTSSQIRFIRPMGAGLSWALPSLWMPSKLGVSASYAISERQTISADYQYQTMKFPVFALDIGHIREQRYGVTLKNFGDSEHFYVSYGLIKYIFRAQVNEDLFRGTSVPVERLFDVSSIGFQWGLGHQWSWGNGVSLGVDWFSVYFHLVEKNKNTEIFDYLGPSHRDKANKMVDLIYKVPVFEALKIQLSYSF